MYGRVWSLYTKMRIFSINDLEVDILLLFGRFDIKRRKIIHIDIILFA